MKRRWNKYSYTCSYLFCIFANLITALIPFYGIFEQFMFVWLVLLQQSICPMENLNGYVKGCNLEYSVFCHSLNEVLSFEDIVNYSKLPFKYSFSIWTISFELLQKSFFEYLRILISQTNGLNFEISTNFWWMTSKMMCQTFKWITCWFIFDARKSLVYSGNLRPHVWMLIVESLSKSKLST